MPITTGLIKAALIQNQTQGLSNEDAANNLEQAIIATIKSADIIYGAPPTLISASPGSPVTGDLSTTKLQ